MISMTTAITASTTDIPAATRRYPFQSSTDGLLGFCIIIPFPQVVHIERNTNIDRYQPAFRKAQCPRRASLCNRLLSELTMYRYPLNWNTSSHCFGHNWTNQ